MSFELEAVSTSPPRRPAPMAAHQIFRLEANQPFDPAVFGYARPGVPSCNRAGGGGSAPPQRAAHYARTQIVPTRGLGYSDANPDELEYLMNRRDNPQRGGIDLPSSLTLCAAVALWTVIIGVVFIMYWQFSATVSAAQAAAAPYIGEAMNHTMSILHHVDESTLGASDIVNSAHAVTDQAVPAMQLALNQTAAMIARLEKLAANPVMQISLTGAAGGGGATIGR